MPNNVLAPPAVISSTEPSGTHEAPRPEPRLYVSFYKGKFEPIPVPQSGEYPWSKIVDALNELKDRVTNAFPGSSVDDMKSYIPAFGLHRLSSPRRKRKNVVAVTAIGLDVERTDPARVIEAIEAYGFAAVVYGSPTDSPSERRLRVVLPVSRELAPTENDGAQLRMAEWLCLPDDCGVVDAQEPERQWFTGRFHDATERFFYECKGEPVDVDDLMSRPLERVWRKKPKKNAKAKASKAANHDTPRTNVEPAADDEIGAIIGAHESYRGRRHELAGAIGGQLRRTGVSRQKAEALGKAYFGAEKWDEHGKWLMGAFDKAPLEVSGREALAEIVGAGAAETFARSFGAFKGKAPTAAPSDSSAGDGCSFATGKEDEPLFVIHRGSVWIQENSGGYGRPVARCDLVPALKQKNLLELVGFAKDGKTILPAEKIYERGGLVSDFEKDFRVPLTTVRGTATLTLVEGHRCREVESAFDADVEAWLAILFGDGLDDAKVWIAACAQRYLDRPAACFIHLGPPDVGKSLVHHVLAYMWNAAAPVELGAAIARFNGRVTRCPIVLDDEARELARKTISTRDFRELVAAGVRDVELKGRECSKLLGCLRYAVTANGTSQLTFTDVDGPDTLAALETRAACHTTPTEAHDAAVAALARLRVNPEIDRADVPRIAGHFAWIQANVTVPARRFLGGRDKGATAALTAGHVSQYAAVFEKVRELLANAPHDDAAAPLIRTRNGSLLVSTAKLASSFPFDRNALANVQAALRLFRTARTSYAVSGKRDEKQSYWVLDEAKLVEALEI